LNDPISNDRGQLKNIFNLDIKSPAKPVGGAFICSLYRANKKAEPFLTSVFNNKKNRLFLPSDSLDVYQDQTVCLHFN
jgi:hypothetical protein